MLEQLWQLELGLELLTTPSVEEFSFCLEMFFTTSLGPKVAAGGMAASKYIESLLDS